jgi:NAD-dependent DNA ligase
LTIRLGSAIIYIMKNYIQIEAPVECPECNSELELVKDQLFCRNNACTAKVNKQIEHYAKVMKIKGLGPKTVEKLDLESISDLYALTEKDLANHLGERMASKLYKEINGSKTTDLATFISAFSIPLIGNTAGTKLAKVVSSVDDITFKVCKTAGLGDIASANLLDWIAVDWGDEFQLLPVKMIKTTIQQGSPSLGLSVALTGKLEGYTRNKLKAELEALGFDIKSAVSGKTNFVLAGANKNPSSTEVKAEKLGIPIARSVEELLELTKVTEI